MSKGKTILIVDDDTTLCDMYAEELKSKGYQVLMAHDGESGFAHALSGSPDLILLDIMMPKINGFGTLQKLKAEPKTSKIPVIVLTALIQEENREKALQLGASDCAVKSEMMPKDIVAKIKKLLP